MTLPCTLNKDILNRCFAFDNYCHCGEVAHTGVVTEGNAYGAIRFPILDNAPHLLVQGIFLAIFLKFCYLGCNLCKAKTYC